MRIETIEEEEPLQVETEEQCYDVLATECSCLSGEARNRYMDLYNFELDLSPATTVNQQPFLPVHL